jgi:hypothetical protein
MRNKGIGPQKYFILNALNACVVAVNSKVVELAPGPSWPQPTSFVTVSQIAIRVARWYIFKPKNPISGKFLRVL